MLQYSSLASRVITAHIEYISELYMLYPGRCIAAAHIGNVLYLGQCIGCCFKEYINDHAYGPRRTAKKSSFGIKGVRLRDPKLPPNRWCSDDPMDFRGCSQLSEYACREVLVSRTARLIAVVFSILGLLPSLQGCLLALQL